MINLKTDSWEIENIEAILFDKDGTFIDLHYFWGKMTELRAEEIIKKYRLNNFLKNELCLKLGYNIQTRKMIPDGITAMYSRQKIIAIFKNDLRDFDVYITELELEEIFDKVSTDFYRDMEKYTKPIPEAIDFIKNVKKMGIKTGIVTSDSIESTNKTLSQFGWENLFDVVLGRESTKETKESGEIAKLALKTINVNPSSTVMIGDTPMDYICAKNAGIEKTILVSSGQIPEEKLKETSKYTIRSVKHIELS